MLRKHLKIILFLFIFCLVGAGAVLLFPKLAQAAFSCDSGTTSTTCYVTSTKVLDDGETISGTGNLVIQNGGSLTCGVKEFFSLDMGEDITIESGGIITCNITNATATNFTIDSGGSIDVSGKGYRGGYRDDNPSEHGEGKGGTGTIYGGGEGAAVYYNAGGGGAHGGNGGQGRRGSTYRSGGTAYGSSTEPTDLGAGGGGVQASGYPGGNGGGAIKITVSGTTTVNGIIKADGQSATEGRTGSYERLPGGGAGGSIWITTGTLAGDGTTTANGGDGFYEHSTHWGGGGAGGRVAIYYTTSTHTGSITAFGGTGYEAGGAGTIFQRAGSQTYGDLLVDNNNVSGADTPFIDGTYTFDNITFQKRANLALSSGDTVTTDNLTIQNTGYLTTAGSLTVNTSFNFNSGTLTLIGGTTSLPSDTTFDLVGTFNFNGGTLNNLTGLNILSGGTFNFSNTVGTINLTTFTLSSGSTFNFNNGILTIPPSLACEGTFNFNGGTLNNLTSLTVSSGGTFNYNGGTFTDLTTLTIAGTFNLNTALSLTDVTIQSGGVLSHALKDPDFDLTVTSDLIIESGGSIDVSGKGYRGGYRDGNPSADGEGKGGTGPAYGGGEGYNNYPWPGGGGAHGGNGGQGRWSGNYRSGGIAYGSFTEPTDFGAGGGGVAASSWPGGNGGGAIKITVSGTTTVYGIIKADGQSATSGYTQSTYQRLPGGGAGGSIWITTGTLAGNGTTTANGGNGYEYSSQGGGGGAGGRIAVYYTTSTHDGSMSTAGGTGYQAGGAGTIFTKAESAANGDLLVDNNNVSGADTPFIDGIYTFDNITSQKRANLVLSPGDTVTTDNLTIQDNATLTTTGSLIADTTFTFTTGIFTLNNGTTTLPTSYNLTLEGTFNFTGGILNNLVGLDILSGGTFTFDNSAETIDLTTFTLQGGGTFNLNEGTLNTPASLDCEGTFNYNDGTINNLTTITVSSGGTFNYNGGTFTDLTTLTIAGTFNLNTALSLTDITIQSGGVLSHALKDPDFDLTVTSDLIIESGGSIDVSGKGYRGGYSDGNPSEHGEGKGGTGPTYGGGEGATGFPNPGGGGAHGGDGGQGRRDGTYRSGGTAYGSSTEPTDFGAGGGGVATLSWPGGNGGGAIKITVSGTTTVNGIIKADGQSAPNGYTGTYSRLPGGGAGGSIWITAGTLAGDGTTTANGGNGFYESSTREGGGGAGGRIALYRQTDTFSGSTTVNGGTGYESGGEGTIFLLLLNQAPDSPTSLSQYKSDCSTSISTGGWTNETQVCLQGYINDSDTDDNVKLQADYTTDAFDNIVDASSTAWCTEPCTASTTISGLSHGTQYRWQARAIDDDSATSSWSQFNEENIAFGVDTTAPTSVSIVSISADSTSQLTITATATDPISGLHSTPYFFKEISGNPGASSSTDWQSPPDFADTGLLTNTQYTYQVKARDVAGNESGYSSLVSKYTLANPPSNLLLTTDSPNQIVISWSANNNPSGTEYFCENITQGTNSSWITGTSWISSDLLPGIEYTFRAKARNGDEVSTSWTSEESLFTFSAGGVAPVLPPVSITGSGNVSQNLGGEISQTFNSGKIAKVVFPSYSIKGTAVSKIEPRVKAEVIKNNPLSQNTQIIGDLVADFKALSGAKEIESFEKEVTVTFTYTDKQITKAGIDEKTLKIYWWDESTSFWKALKSTLNTATNTVTAPTLHFTLFALMGELVIEEEEVVEKPIEGMTIEEIKAKIREIQQKIIELLTQLIQIIQEEIIQLQS